jgi:hypothetical protein
MTSTTTISTSSRVNIDIKRDNSSKLYFPNSQANSNNNNRHIMSSIPTSGSTNRSSSTPTAPISASHNPAFTTHTAESPIPRQQQQHRPAYELYSHAGLKESQSVELHDHFDMAGLNFGGRLKYNQRPGAGYPVENLSPIKPSFVKYISDSVFDYLCFRIDFF